MMTMRRRKMRLLLMPKGANVRRLETGRRRWSITRLSCPEMICTDLLQQKN